MFYYKDIIDEVMRQNEALKNQVDTMMEINQTQERKDEEMKRQVAEAEQKTEQLHDEIRVQKEAYEKKIQEIIGKRFEEKLDITEFYTKQIDMLETELKTQKQIRKMVEKHNENLKAEIETLAKVVRTSRNHFKELEKVDFENLQNQLKKYESKIEKLKISESQVEELRAAKAKGRMVASQTRQDREMFNISA